MATVEQLQKDGQDLFPVTRAEAVYDDDDVTLQSRVDSGVYLDEESSEVEETPWVTSDMIRWDTIKPMMLLAVASQSSKEGSSSGFASGNVVAWSDNKVGEKTLDGKVDPFGLLASQSGAIYYTHKKGAKYIEAEMTLTGSGYGFWQSDNKNYNPLNGAVVLNTTDKVLKQMGGDYGGATFYVYYDVSQMTPGQSFFINPQVKSYRSTNYVSTGGTASNLVVKVYGNEG